MMNCLEKTLHINENIIFGKLLDGTEYILLIKKEEQIPMFLKEDVLNILKYIDENSCTEESLLEVFGEGAKAILDLFYKYGMICEEEAKNKEIGFEGDFEALKLKLKFRAYDTRTPTMAKIEVTYNCNYRCKYCYVEGLKEKFLPLEDIKTIMIKLRNAGVTHLFLTGGEPFLHPNFLEMVEFAASLKFILTVQTNASFINEEMVEKLKAFRHLTFGISFHSSNEERFDKFTQIKGSFQKTVRAGRLLKENNIPFFFKLIVTKENQDYVKDDIVFLEENEFKYQVFAQILPSIVDSVDTSSYTADRECLKWLYDTKRMTFQKSSCSAFRTKMWISSTGDVYPCELTRIKMGNLVTDSFEDVWYGEHAEQILTSDIYQEPEKCKSCGNKKYCNKCLAYLNYASWKSGLNEFCKNASLIQSVS